VVTSTSSTIRPSPIFFFSSLFSVENGLVITSNSPSLLHVEFPVLQTVSSYFELEGNEELLEISFPELTYVGDSVFIQQNNLTEVSFPTLTSLNGSLRIIEEENLSKIGFPQLVTCNGDFEISGISLLTNLEATKLNYVTGSLIVGSNALMSITSFPNLNYVGGELDLVFVEGGPQALTEISFPVLMSVGSRFYMAYNFVLKKASFPLLDTIGGIMDIELNTVLGHIDFSSLRFICANGISGTNTLQPDPTYVICPNLIDTVNCNTFHVVNVAEPTQGCQEEERIIKSSKFVVTVLF